MKELPPMGRLRKTARFRRVDTWPAAYTAAGGAGAEAAYFTLDPAALFGPPAPLEIEIGAGRGEFITARAAAMVTHNFLAVETAGALAELLVLRAAQAQLDNLRVVRMDARPLVNLFLAAGAVAAYHIYFPDPWPKRRHAKHRLFTPVFVNNLARTLRAGGRLYVATDVRDYAEAIFAMIGAAGLHPSAVPVPGAAETGFARRFIAQGRTVHARAFIRDG